MGLFTRKSMGDEARDHCILNAREGVEPREVIDDYGEHDRDYTDDQHAEADARAGNDRVQRFYDSTRQNTVKVKRWF